MVLLKYVPERGDVIWIDCDPRLGHEQGGRRPALVLSPQSYNKLIGLFLIMPITSKIKGYPFEIILKGGMIDGVVLSDQIKSFDWTKRKVEFIEKAPLGVLEQALETVDTLLDIPQDH